MSSNVPAHTMMDEHLANLDMVNFQIADLKRIKEHLERVIVCELELAKFDNDGNVLSVVHDGEQTKYIGKYKVKIKTPSLWKINKSEYEVVAPRLNKAFDPIKTSLSYRVDKRILDNVNTYGSEEDKHMLGEFLELDYSKPSVTLTANS